MLPGSARRLAGGLLTACTILVVVLGALVAHRTSADRFDRAVDGPVISWFAHRPELAARLAAPGSAVGAGALTAVLVVACLLTRRLNGAVLAATAVPVSVGLVEVLLKPLVHRTYLGILAYPSGHTTALFALAATVSILLLAPASPADPRRARVLISVAACLEGCLVAVGVIGLRWHYLTDTTAGAAVGIGTACGLALALDLAFGRVALSRGQEVAGERARPGRERPPARNMLLSSGWPTRS